MEWHAEVGRKRTLVARSLLWLNVTAVDGIWMDVEEVGGSWVTKYLHIIGAPQQLPGPTLYSTLKPTEFLESSSVPSNPRTLGCEIGCTC